MTQLNDKAQQLAAEKKKPEGEQDKALIGSLTSECEGLREKLDGLDVSEEKKMEVMNKQEDYHTSIDQDMVYEVQDRKIYLKRLNGFEYQAYVENGTYDESGITVTQTIDIEYSGNSYYQVAGDVVFIIEQDKNWLQGAPVVGTSLLVDDESRCKFASDDDKNRLINDGVQRVLILEKNGSIYSISATYDANTNSITVTNNLNMNRCIEAIHIEEPNITIPIPGQLFPLGFGNYFWSCGGKCEFTTNTDIHFGWYAIEFDIKSFYWILTLHDDDDDSYLEINNPLGITWSFQLMPSAPVPIGYGIVGDAGPTISVGGEGKGKVIYEKIYEKEGFKAKLYITYVGIPWVSSSEALLNQPDFAIKFAQMDGEVYNSADFGGSLSLAEIVGLGAAYSNGLVIKGETNNYEGFAPKDTQKTRWHACLQNQCFEIFAKYRVGPVGVSVVAAKGLVNFPLFDAIKARDFPPFYKGYSSTTFGDHAGGKLCPHWGYKLNVGAYSKDFITKGAAGAQIWYEFPGKRFDECAYTYSGVSDANGIVNLYAPEGQEITVHVRLKDGRTDSRTITKKNYTESVFFYFDMDSLSFDKNTTDQCSDIPNPVYYTFPSFADVRIRIPDTVPKRSGHLFTCWNDKPDGTGSYTCRPGESITLKNPGIIGPNPPTTRWCLKRWRLALTWH